MIPSLQFVILLFVFSTSVDIESLNGQLFLQPVRSQFNYQLETDPPAITEDVIFETSTEDGSPETSTEDETLETSTDDEATDGSNSTETYEPSTSPNKKQTREESGSVTVSKLTEHEKGIIIIAVILAVFILCLVVCALCVCCTTKNDDNDDTELYIQAPLPEPSQPESGWTSIRSESGNEPTTRPPSKIA